MSAKVTITSKDREEFEVRIDGFRILDDTFMNEVFKDQPALVQMVLRTILKFQDLEVTEVRIQDPYTNWQGRGVRIDVFARDSSGRLYDIEIQRAKYGTGAKRARFNMSLMDAAYTKAGTKVPDPEETFIIFVTETDIFNKGLPTYHVERVITETGDLFDDKGHIVYVNGAYVGDDPIGVLMHDFRCTDPNQMQNEMLRNRVSELKGSPEWRDTMCQAFEETREEGRNEGVVEGKVEAYSTLIQDGVISLPFAAERLGLTTDELRQKAKELGITIL